MNDITVLIPTSSIPSHPSTHIIDTTICTLRRELPDAPIIITCDGQEDQAGRREQYDKYVIDLKARHPNVLTFDQHVHQTGMLWLGLAFVFTPLVMYLEHDWELLPGIEWTVIQNRIKDGVYNYVKLHAGARIHPLHEHLMEERETPFIRTRQWSQNPHIASAEFYRQRVMPMCEGKKDYIENVMHGVVGNSAWEEYRCAIYNPIEGDMARVRHLDGREGQAV